MRKTILTLTVSILATLIIFVFYLSIYGIKTNSFNSFINSKAKEYNPKLDIKLDQVFIKLNFSQTSININTKDANFIAENNNIKISNIDINLNILNFIRKENSIKNIKIKSNENSIREVTSLLNALDFNLSRYIFYSQIKNGTVNFEINTKFKSQNQKDYSYYISGGVKNAKFNIVGLNSLDKINFDFKIKDNITKIINLAFGYENLNFSSKSLEIIKKNNTFDIKGDIENDKVPLDPSLLLKLVNLKQDYLSDKNVLLQAKNLFSFQLNSNYKVKNLKINSTIDFDEIYFNENIQNIVYLKNGKIKSKYEKNQFFANLSSNFAFIDNKDLKNNFKNNTLELILKKKNGKNIEVQGNIYNENTLINPQIILKLFKLDPNFISDDKINIQTDNKFQLEIDKKNKIKKYLLNSNIKLDKLTPNKSFQSLFFLRNVKTDLTLNNESLKVDLTSNYSFFNDKYNNSQDDNSFDLKLEKINKSGSNVEIFFNTKDNKINTKEFKNVLNLQTNLINDQIVKLDSNFLIKFFINEKNKIKNFYLNSDLNLDNLEVKYKSNQIKKYIQNYQDKIILKKPKILINYSDEILDFQLDGKYTFKNQYDNIFIKTRGNKNNFEIYSLLNFEGSIINLNEIEYLKEKDKPLNLEILLNYNDKETIVKKISLIENKNEILLNNLSLSKNLKIIKFDEINLKFLNKNKNLNNLNIKRNLTNYEVTGSNYDIEKILETFLKSNKKNKTFEFFENLNTTINFDIKKLYLEEQAFLEKFSGDIDIKNNRIILAKIDAKLNKDNKFMYSLRITPENEKITNILIQEPKPFINNYKFIKGFEEGELYLNSKSINNSSRSNLKINNFKIQKVPVLAKILTLASLQGIADLLTGEGIRFDEFEMDYKTKNNLTEIEEMYALGPSISIMMEGYIERDILTSLRGTLVPATTINKTIAKIPLLGDILVGSKTGEGVFGVSFKIKGPPNDLKSTVNPIKTLTPRFITRTLENIKGN